MTEISISDNSPGSSLDTEEYGYIQELTGVVKYVISPWYVKEMNAFTNTAVNFEWSAVNDVTVSETAFSTAILYKCLRKTFPISYLFIVINCYGSSESFDEN